jgi:glycerol uptake facilitator-like aquaporin
MKTSLTRRLVAEFVGTAFLLAAVVGSGIMAERLANGNVALALLANTIATGAALVALILTFGPISGAHAWPTASAYIIAQILGGVGGTIAAHLMFGLPVVLVSHHARGGGAQFVSEFVATFGLLSVIWGCSRSRSAVVPFAVGAYITAAYWFTSSTSFANPAVTIARSLSNTFAGIRPGKRSTVHPCAASRCARHCYFDGWSLVFLATPRTSSSPTMLESRAWLRGAPFDETHL